MQNDMELDNKINNKKLIIFYIKKIIRVILISVILFFLFPFLSYIGSFDVKIARKISSLITFITTIYTYIYSLKLFLIIKPKNPFLDIIKYMILMYIFIISIFPLKLGIDLFLKSL